MHNFTLIFLLTLFAGTALQWWLLRRHASHVSAHRDRVPEPFADRIALTDHRKAADYTLAKVRFSEVRLFAGIALLLWWTLGGGLDWFLAAWASTTLSPLLAGIGFVLSVFLVNGILELPLTVWRTFALERKFGFNKTRVKRFVIDLLLQTLLAAMIGTPLLCAILWLMDEAGRFWWLIAWAVWILFMLVITWLYPLLIAPLFNRFKPLADSELKQRIQSLLARCRFESRGIFVMDGSRRSGHSNAYFTGFGKGKRIVLFDTLMESLDDDELEAVLAHELGHFKLRHLRKMLLAAFFSTLIGFAILGELTTQSWFYQSLGVSQESPAAALILFLMTVPVFTVFLTPIASFVVRRHEFQADEFATAQTGGRSLIQALIKLYRDNASTLTPDPVFSAFHDSHPPALVRISRISSTIRATGKTE